MSEYRLFFAKILFFPVVSFFLGMALHPRTTDIYPPLNSQNFALDSIIVNNAVLPEVSIGNFTEILADWNNKIIIPADFQQQKYNLSCEAASLKMALSAKGIFVSEDEILAKIGQDPTPHQNNIWGDPDIGFVGDINGKICQTGYGVHWGPVAKAAQNWALAEDFSDWTLEKLITELNQGNPVIMWGTSPTNQLHAYSWLTPEGKLIKTYWEAHVRTIIGFAGEPSNPTKIILYDPMYGKLSWDTDYFLENWQAFNFSGVAIR